MKNIVVFGATGKTGLQVVRNALEKGHHVTAFVRDKSRLNLKYHNLNVIKGDVRNSADVEKAVKKQDIVISTLGVAPGQNPVCKLGIENILAAMQINKVKKLIAVSAYGARETSRGFYSTILNLLLGKIMRDKNEMESIIEKSKVDWTVVRPVILTNGPFTDSYNVTTDEILKGIHFISRDDVARFILDLSEQKTFKKKFVAIYQ